MNIRKNYKTHVMISGLLSLLVFDRGGQEGDRILRIIGAIAFMWLAFVMLSYHRCPKCRKYLPLFDFKSTHCKYCGSSLETPENKRLKCPKCGKENKRYDADNKQIRYCGYCGCRLEDNQF